MACSLLASTKPFVEGELGLSVENKVYMEVSPSTKVYELLVDYIPKHIISKTLHSSRPTVGKEGSKDCCGKGGHGHNNGLEGSRVNALLGLGLFYFHDHAGNELTALHQTLGNPVGSDCGATFFTNLILFADSVSGNEVLKGFLSHLVEESDKNMEGTFKCYSWHVRYQYWRSKGSCKARPLSSVILPAKSLEKLTSDIDNFLNADTQAFYEAHGIPYKRSYLFYGIPGAGKTSLIQALAGHYKRSISYLQPTHPDMTDDSLKESINELPADTIVVFEDIDSLFAVDRSNKVAKSALTFSGLLNAMDGVGSANGQIFILTTNLRDCLDPALIRNGRVDMHIEFSYVVREQMEKMWSSFYPQSSELSGHFADTLTNLLGERHLAAAGLQHFFVMNMRNNAQQALQNIGWIIDDLNEKATESATKLLAPEKEENRPTESAEESSRKTNISSKKADAVNAVEGTAYRIKFGDTGTLRVSMKDREVLLQYESSETASSETASPEPSAATSTESSEDSVTEEDE